MRITVIGGHGRTGLLIVELLVKGKHEVVATIRNPKHMADLVKRGAEAVMLDLADSPPEQIAAALKGADAVIFAAGSGAGESSALDRIGVRRTIAAAEKAGVKRYIAISSIGASTGLSTRGMGAEMVDYYKQKRAAGKLIAASGLDWTLLEPAELTDDPAAGRLKASLDEIDEPAPVARADVAAAAVAVLDLDASIGKAIQLAGGRTPLKTALAKAVS